MENYRIVEKIGKGSFGIVSRIRRKSDSKEFVWKEFNYGCMNDKEKQLLVTEVNILRELRHINIVRYLDRIIDKEKTKLYIVMEYCQGGDLGEFIRKKRQQKKFIEEEFIWQIFSQLVSALKECHLHREGNLLKPILHRDIKPGNVFLTKDNVAKLGDFGLAKELGDGAQFTKTNVGTPYYMSPEMILEEEYDERSDIWALGCLLYEMATLCPPFEASNQMALAIKIKRGLFPPVNTRYSLKLIKIINWMLKTDHSSRPYIEDLSQLIESHDQSFECFPPSPKILESNNNQIYLSKMKDVRLLEEQIQRQKEQLELKEIAVTHRERRCKDLERELERRERELYLREKRFNSLQNSILSPNSSTSSVSSSVSSPSRRKDLKSTEIRENTLNYKNKTKYHRNFLNGMGNTDLIFKSLKLHDNQHVSPVSSCDSSIEKVDLYPFTMY